MHMRIFLIGFMGSGKTHWGKRWASLAGWDFFDLDEIIEQRAGKTISEIFEQDGETPFREIESRELRRLEAVKKGIISCGGGTPCFHDNMDWMNAHGTTVYLSSGPKKLFDNIMKDSTARPLMKGVNEAEILYFVESKLKERLPFYEKAGLTLPVSELDEGSLRALLEN